jgi:hypothetical protein
MQAYVQVQVTPYVNLGNRALKFIFFVGTFRQFWPCNQSQGSY